MEERNEQEWTAQTVFDLMGTDYGDGWKRERLVADAHNAALAAERENTDHKRKVIREQADKLQQLRSQLAAARAAIEKHNRNASDICHYHIQSK